MEKLIKVAINDFRLVFRDRSLNLFFAFPLLNLLVVRYGLPYVATRIDVLNDYIPILMMFFANQGALIFGFIYSMVLIDEKDTDVAKVYGVLPVSKFWFVIYRLAAPFLLSTVSTYLLLMVQTYYEISFFVNIAYSALAGLTAPLMVLFVAIKAKNKLEGMTWQKLFNIPIMLPILAFFVPSVYSLAFALLPAYWAYQGFNNFIAGGQYIAYLLIGFIFNLVLIGLMARRFARIHFQ